MRGFLLLSARIAISGILLYFALRGISFAEIEARLNASSAPWFISWVLLAVLTNIFQVFLGAMRWQAISALCDAPLTLPRAFRYNMIGTFFNQTLPSAIGGDAVRLWLVSRIAGWRAATYSVLVDRAIGLIALAMLVVFSLPWSFQLMVADPARPYLLTDRLPGHLQQQDRFEDCGAVDLHPWADGSDRLVRGPLDRRARQIRAGVFDRTADRADHDAADLDCRLG